MGYMLTCDVCHKGNGGIEGTTQRRRPEPRRYALHRYVPLTADEKVDLPPGKRFGRMEGAGSIDLCDDCWEHIAKPRAKPQRRPKMYRNQYGEGPTK